MQDHVKTVKHAWHENKLDYFRRSSYLVNHRLKNVNDLHTLNYDLYLFSRDNCIQEYHAKARAKEFEEILRELGKKSEIVSNSSFEEFLRIRDIYGDIMPISKLVEFNDIDYLLRFDGKMKVLRYVADIDRVDFSDETNKFLDGDKLLHPITYEYSKPNPRTIESAVHVNIFTKRIPLLPRALMVGDQYLTDIVAGNLALPIFGRVDTALVKPYKPLSDRPTLIVWRYLVDKPAGRLMGMGAK